MLILGVGSRQTLKVTQIKSNQDRILSLNLSIINIIRNKAIYADENSLLIALR